MVESRSLASVSGKPCNLCTGLSCHPGSFVGRPVVNYPYLAKLRYAVQPLHCTVEYMGFIEGWNHTHKLQFIGQLHVSRRES
jgi:hypothetical protein